MIIPGFVNDEIREWMRQFPKVHRWDLADWYGSPIVRVSFRVRSVVILGGDEFLVKRLYKPTLQYTSFNVPDWSRWVSDVQFEIAQTAYEITEDPLTK